MACIDKNMTEEQVEDRIHDFVNNLMTESEEIRFGKHLCDCKHCDKLTKAYIKFTKGAKLHFSNEELNKAYDESRWQDVIRWGNKMRWMESPEDVYPIEEKISKANQNIQTKIEEMKTQASALRRLGKLDEAIAIYDEILKIDPQNADVINYKGTVFFYKGDLERALKLYLETLTVDPDHHLALRNTGFAYMTMKKWADAVVFYKKALNIDSRDSHILANTGASLCELGRYDEGLEYINKAWEVSSHKPEIAIYLANVYYYKKDIDTAEGWIKKALKALPNHPSALAVYGLILIDKQQIDEATHILEQCLNAQPNSVEFMNNLALAYSKTQDAGKIRKATELITRAYQIDPNNYSIRENYENIQKGGELKLKPMLIAAAG